MIDLKILKNQRIPQEVEIELTYACPLKCKHCFQTLKPDVKRELSAKEWKGVIDQLFSEGVLRVTFTGGEVFTRRDFFEIANYAKKKGLMVGLISSGVLVTEQIANKLKKLNPFDVAISLYSSKSPIHDSIVGVEGACKKTMNAIKLLKSKGIRIRINTCAITSNSDSLLETIFFVKKLKIPHSVAFWLHPPKKDKMGNFHEQLMAEKLITSLKQMKSNGFNNEQMKMKIKGGKAEGELSCGIGKNRCSISPYGVVYPCVPLPLSMGNLKKTSFNKIWNSNKFKRLGKINLSYLPKCKKCELEPYCHICLADFFMRTRNLYIPDPQICEYTKCIREVFKE